jgi:hypothetical protein
LVVTLSGPVEDFYTVSVTPAATISSGQQALPVRLVAQLPSGVVAETGFDVGVWIE